MLLLFGIAGSALRVAAAFDQFWLDEVWSWSLAQRARSWVDVLTLAHDNNHQLNTLWIYVLGQERDWVLYRLPALACGIGTLALVPWLVRAHGRLAAVFAAALFASSCLLITFSSEARGYGPAIFFALAAWGVAERALLRPTARLCALFALLVVLGTSAHLTFLHAYGGIFLWSAWHWARPAFHARAWLARMAALHAAPLAFLALDYAAFVRGMNVGGGPVRPTLAVIGETLCFAFGAPHAPWLALALALGAVLVLALDAVSTARAGSDAWLGTLGIVVLFPLLSVFTFRTEFLAPRYFLPSVVFFLLALARVCARLVALGGPRAIVASLVVLATVGGNLADVLRRDRGNYLGAFQRIAERTSGDVATLTGAEDFETNVMVIFYRRYLPARPAITYTPHDALPRGGTEWILLETIVREPEPKTKIRRAGKDYDLVGWFPYRGPSGLHWFLYRRSG